MEKKICHKGAKQTLSALGMLHYSCFGEEMPDRKRFFEEYQKDLAGQFDEYDSYDRNGQFKDHRGYFYKTINGDTVHFRNNPTFAGQEWD